MHYTDVSPAVAVVAVTRGGNHPFNYLFREKKGQPVFQKEAFAEVLADVRDQLLSPVYVGWKPGYLPEERAAAQSVSVEGVAIEHTTPRGAFESVTEWLAAHQAEWNS